MKVNLRGLDFWGQQWTGSLFDGFSNLVKSAGAGAKVPFCAFSRTPSLDLIGPKVRNLIKSAGAGDKVSQP